MDDVYIIKQKITALEFLEKDEHIWLTTKTQIIHLSYLTQTKKQILKKSLVQLIKLLKVLFIDYYVRINQGRINMQLVSIFVHQEEL